MMSRGYFRLCITNTGPDGKKVARCFKIPELVDAEAFHAPDPHNFPELELAGTILSLVEFAEPVIKDPGITKELTDIVNKFVNTVREGLPAGVELKRVKEKIAKAA